MTRQRGAWGESKVLHICRRVGFLDGMEQQYRVGQYRLDFAWPDVGVAIEADGSVHRFLHVMLRDRVRDKALRESGWLVYRLDIDASVKRLTEEIEAIRALTFRLRRSPALIGRTAA